MAWFKRSSRALKSSIVSAERRRRLEFDCLEDRTTPSATGVIAGNVFFDNNSNAFNDGTNGIPSGLIGDFAMPGATVNLNGTTNLGTPVALSTATKSDGSFQFVKLEPGVYQVAAATAAFQTAIGGAGNLGGNVAGNQIQTIVLSQGETEANLRFGLPGLTANSNVISLRLFMNTSIGQVSQVFGNSIPTAGSGRVIADGATSSQATGTASLEGDVLSAGAGVAGVRVQLSGVDSKGAPYLFVTTTDSAGHYRFANLAAASYFINVIPNANFRATGATVGSLGGSNPRADQLAPSLFAAGATGIGYNFNLTPFSGNLDAGLANDVGNGSLGTFSDGVTSDPSIRGRLVNPSGYTALDARFTTGGSNEFVSVKSSLNADGSFVLNEQTMRDIFGGGFPDGAYAVEIRATAADGSVLTKTVSFTLKASGPIFLSSFANISNTAAAANTTLILSGAYSDPNITNSVVVMHALKGTTPIDINVELYDKDAPRSVANFFNYLDRYALNGGTLFHRLHKETGLEVIQGGGFNFTDATNTISAHITQDATVRNEFSTDRPNTRGTLAGAKLGGDPDSFTSEFFFNLNDANASTLSVNNNGGFTVFGKVQSDDDLAALDSLASVPIKNIGGQSELPLVDGNTLDANNVERVKTVEVVSRDGELTYSAVSSNNAVVTASVGGFQGNALTLDYQAAGSATITVTCTDSTGNTAVSTFVVTVT